MLLFLGFYVLSSMAGAGIQSWLITVLHEVNGLDLAIASIEMSFGDWRALPVDRPPPLATRN